MAEHPITPPPELVQQWASESLATQHLCTQAARWGADQELDACCEWLADCPGIEHPELVARSLRAARRPKPPSPKGEALKVLEALIEWQRIDYPGYQALRHALEQLDD